MTDKKEKNIMTLEEAKKILSENNIRIDERAGELRDSANYDTAYTLKPLVKGDEEAPEGFESLEDIYWRESDGTGWRENHQDFLLRIKKSSDPHVVTKKLWYRIAEYMIEDRDNEPCHASDIKRGLGLTGYATSFAAMKRGGFFEVADGGIKLSDWAVEKYREAKRHAEADRKSLESEMLKKYGTLEDQMEDYYQAVDEIKSYFEDDRREERLRNFRSARDREKMRSL